MCPVVDLGLAQAGIPQRERMVEPDGINQLQPHYEPQGEPTTLVINANINPDDGRNEAHRSKLCHCVVLPLSVEKMVFAKQRRKYLSMEPTEVRRIVSALK